MWWRCFSRVDANVPPVGLSQIDVLGLAVYVSVSLLSGR